MHLSMPGHARMLQNHLEHGGYQARGCAQKLIGESQNFFLAEKGESSAASILCSGKGRKRACYSR